MITESTAVRIVEVFDEIEKCEGALALIKDAIDFTGYVAVSSDKNEEGYAIDISPKRMEKVIKKQLKSLEKEYKDLNEIVLDEAGEE